MDLFSRLPPNIRRDIIVHVESYSSIAKLIRASPTMLLQYTTDRYSIARAILKPILALDDTGEILQDALISIHSRDDTITTDVHYGFSRLLARSRTDPIAQKNKNMTLKLYRKISYMISWVEAYVSKAPSSIPSKLYMDLPGVASTWNRTRYQGEMTEIEPVFFSQLRPSERCRFLRAFMKVEAICGGISVLDQLRTIPSDTVRMQMDFFRPLVSYNFKLMVYYEEMDWAGIFCAAYYIATSGETRSKTVLSEVSAWVHND